MEIRDDFLPLNKPSITEAEIERVVACLKSGWITTGPACKEFEDRFSELTGAPFAVSLTSATAGLHLMLSAMDLKEGDEIITPSLTFASTVNMIALHGAKPIFADIDYGTLNLDPAGIERCITKRTRAVIPVHFAGAPVDMDPILALAKAHGITIIEDAAHAVGTYYKGIHAGGFGYPAIFSFHPIKNITSGEGGMVTLNDPQMEKRLRLLRFHGIERDAWKRYGKGGNPEYDITAPGFKYNLTDIHASLGVAQLSRLREMNENRARLAALYLDGLQGVNGVELPEVPAYPHVHSWHLFVIKITAMSRGDFMQRLSDYNIGYGIHFPAAHLLTYVKERFPVERGTLPATEAAAERIVSLPLFPSMQEADVSYVCRAIKEIVS
jgi:UDP-4-amino-4-deoxy-L-arabinose-oxoglutarate aminotransferase